jgi:hypothetical protein
VGRKDTTIIFVKFDLFQKKAKTWFDKHYLDYAPVKSTVEKWFAKFKLGDARSPQNNFE